jgi:hypothetical protein
MKKTIVLENPYETIDKKFIQKSVTYPMHELTRIDIPMRGLVIGSSGSGKTQTVYNIWKNMKCFTKVYLYAKDLKEPIYMHMIEEMEKLGKKLGTQLITYSDDIEQVKELSYFDSSQNNLVIFDDMMNEMKGSKKKGEKTASDRILDIYTRGRHQNVSSLFVSQSYFKTNIIVRQNTDYVFIKKIASTKDLNRIISEYAVDVTKKEIMDYYQKTVRTKNSFLLIDMRTNDPRLKIRNGFDPFSS